MITHLAHFEFSGEQRWGIVNGETIHLLTEKYLTTKKLLADKATIFAHVKQGLSDLKTIKLADIELLSPIVGNARVICQGANYRSI